MASGAYDQQISITRESVTGTDSFGDDVKSVATVASVWSSVAYLEGRELTAAQQRFAEARYLIRIRRIVGETLQRTDAITWNGQTLDILDIQGQGTRALEWQITAADHVA